MLEFSCDRVFTEPVPRRRPLRAFCRRDGHGAGSPSPCPPPRGPPHPARRAACSAAPPATGPAQPHGAAGPPGPSVWRTRPRRERRPQGCEQVRRGAARAPRLPQPPPQPQPTRLPPRTPQTRAADPRAAPAGFWSRGVSGEPEAGPGASGASATWSRGPPLSPVGSECWTARLPVGRCPWKSQEAAPTPQTRMPAQ